MKEQLLETAIIHGIAVHLLFPDEKPIFGDLFSIRGFTHPDFPPTNRFDFGASAHLGFDQVDDYFGIPSHEQEGTDVKIWLYPLVNGQSVYHHHGPFDGVELSYDVLRNPPKNGQLFLQVVADFALHLPVQVIYTLREQDLGSPPDLITIENDMSNVVSYWRSREIEPGSVNATRITR